MTKAKKKVVKKKPAKMGRPRKKIDWEKVRKLCYMQCTAEEISAFFEISIDTFLRLCKRKFNCTSAEYIKNYSAGGRMSLRRKQMELALAGDRTMLVWLGKQYLGQSDKREIEASVQTLNMGDIIKNMDDSEDEKK